MTTRFPKRVTRQIFLPVNCLEISENDGAMRIGFKRHATGLTSKTRNPSMERIPRHIVSTSGNSGMDHSQKAIPSLNSLIWGSKRHKHCAFCHWRNTKQELIDDGVSRHIRPFSIQAVCSVVEVPRSLTEYHYRVKSNSDNWFSDQSTVSRSIQLSQPPLQSYRKGSE